MSSNWKISEAMRPGAGRQWSRSPAAARTPGYVRAPAVWRRLAKLETVARPADQFAEAAGVANPPMQPQLPRLDFLRRARRQAPPQPPAPPGSRAPPQPQQPAPRPGPGLAPETKGGPGCL